MKTLGQAIKAAVSIVPAVYTSTTSSETVVDTMGFLGVLWLITVGNLDTTSGDETYTAAIYESDNADGSSASAISGASASLTADNQVAKIQVSGLGTGSRKRYQFARFTLAGTTPSCPGAAVALLGETHGQLAPAQAPDANV